MKTTLLAFLGMILFAFHKVSAQPCSLGRVQFENVHTGTDGKCYADIYFDMDRNNGNKFIYLHFWSMTNFNKVDKSKFKNGGGPRYADIFGKASNAHPALATIAIDNDDDAAPVWNSYNYRPDASVPVVKGAALQVSANPVSGSGPHALYRYSVKAVPLGMIDGGCSAANIGVIVWSTQANSVNSQIHCSLIEPAINQYATITGTANCATAQYTVHITNTSNKTRSGKIDFYTDNGIRPNDGIFDPATDTKFDEVSYFTVAPNQTLTITRSIPSVCLGYNIFAQVTFSDNFTQTQPLFASACSTLPYKLSSFTVNRAKQNVVIKWQTVTEQHVRGFNLLRLTEKGRWEVLAFVPSQAAGGSSSEVLSYQYIDVNAYKGVSQYRIEELGVDGKTGMSDVRLVRGEEQGTGVTLYPNPSATGNATLVFNNASVRDILVSDASGKVVQQLRGVTSGAVALGNLGNGFYSIRVVDRTRGITTVEKMIVRK